MSSPALEGCSYTPSPSEDPPGPFSWDVLRPRAVKQRCPPRIKWLSQPVLTGPPPREQGALVCLPGQSGLAVLDLVWEVLPTPGLTQPAGSQLCPPLPIPDLPFGTTLLLSL